MNDIGTEGITDKKKRNFFRLSFLKEANSSMEIMGFSFPLIEGTLTVVDASEIESKRKKTLLCKTVPESRYDIVVHASPIKGMGVCDDGFGRGREGRERELPFQSQSIGTFEKNGFC